MHDTSPTPPPSTSDRITAKISALADWRGETLAHVRQLIHEAAPDVVEEWKWKGTPVWSHNGIVCTGESYKGRRGDAIATRIALAAGSGAPIHPHQASRAAGGATDAPSMPWRSNAWATNPLAFMSSTNCAR